MTITKRKKVGWLGFEWKKDRGKFLWLSKIDVSVEEGGFSSVSKDQFIESIDIIIDIDNELSEHIKN